MVDGSWSVLAGVAWWGQVCRVTGLLITLSGAAQCHRYECEGSIPAVIGFRQHFCAARDIGHLPLVEFPSRHGRACRQPPKTPVEGRGWCRCSSKPALYGVGDPGSIWGDS